MRLYALSVTVRGISVPYRLLFLVTAFTAFNKKTIYCLIKSTIRDRDRNRDSHGHGRR